jgi:multiple sugar transport system substrate-binding protein
VLAGCAPAAEGPSDVDGEFDWKRFDGGSITVLTPQNPWYTAIEPLIPEFEELTGISVDLQALPEEQFRQRRQVVLTGRSDAVDVYMTQPVQDGAQYAAAGWYNDIQQFVDNESLTAADYEFDDIGAGLIDSATVGEVVIGLPVMVDVEMFYYRKDILSAAGVDVPQTMEELEQVAAKIDDPSGVRAYASRGRSAEAVTQMSIFLYNFGGDWTNGEGKAAFNSEEGVEAFTFYGGMLDDYAPAGAVGNSWQELMPLFQQGKIAMWSDSSGFLSSIVDPAAATPEVIENIGFARMPAGPGGEYNSTLPWATAISPFSSHADEAWYFVQWATGADVVSKLQAAGVAGARESIDFPATVPAEWVDAFRYGLTIARPKLPVVVPVAQVRDAIGQAIVTCIENNDVCEAAVQDAAEEFDLIVEDAG